MAHHPVDRGWDPEERERQIVGSLTEAFADLMEANPSGFRTKFRKMAADPFAFFRGSACVFYDDVAGLDDPFADERTGRVWIQGDLHAENYGTYMDGAGTLIFDVNDFDEAYLGHFTWDLQRLAASVALMCWQKAIPDTAIAELIRGYAGAYLDQVRTFATGTGDDEFSLRLDTTSGLVRTVLLEARLATRVDLLDATTELDGFERRFRLGPGVRELDDDERATVEAAFDRYLETIPPRKRGRSISYRIKDVVGRSGFGIGSAGLPAYNVLIEGPSQALENDVVLAMKQGNVASPGRVVDDPRADDYFQHPGHRTAVSQRALQAHADPFLGHTTIDGVGFVVSEFSPYENDLEWDDITEPDEMAPVLDALGRATAKIHCVSDEDSDHTLVDFQTEDAIMDAVDGRTDELVEELVSFGLTYGEVARDDHRRFVDAFRADRIPGVTPT